MEKQTNKKSITVELNKPQFDFINNYVKNSRLYSDAAEFVLEATRLHQANLYVTMTKAQNAKQHTN